jgi:hypothetical protein
MSTSFKFPLINTFMCYGKDSLSSGNIYSFPNIIHLFVHLSLRLEITLSQSKKPYHK